MLSPRTYVFEDRMTRYWSVRQVISFCVYVFYDGILKRLNQQPKFKIYIFFWHAVSANIHTFLKILQYVFLFIFFLSYVHIMSSLFYFSHSHVPLLSSLPLSVPASLMLHCQLRSTRCQLRLSLSLIDVFT